VKAPVRHVAVPARSEVGDLAGVRLPPEHHHRDLTGGWLRAAVFGAMDGLVSNTALISGVGGAGTSNHIVVLTGLAGLVGGALSMAAGEWTSVQTQNEATLAEVAQESLELRRSPLSEEAELVEIWRDRGLEPELAREVARALHRDPATALRVHTQEELGIDPDHLPSPWQAAGASLLAFTAGAFVPLFPFLVQVPHALTVALLLAMVGLFTSGALASRFSGRTATFSGVRQLLIGAACAALTYGVGTAVGAGTGT
jgi:VIT1/CCC1 family predicted Fe2+/Mn2+ transporter